MTLLIPVTPGELLDRISILRIKLRKVSDRDKLKTVGQELDELTKVWDLSPYASRVSADVLRSIRQLTEVNETIWEAEDEVRMVAASHHLAMAAIKARDANNRRTALKRSINDELDCVTTEVKEYK